MMVSQALHEPDPDQDQSRDEKREHQDDEEAESAAGSREGPNHEGLAGRIVRHQLNDERGLADDARDRERHSDDERSRTARLSHATRKMVGHLGMPS